MNNKTKLTPEGAVVRNDDLTNFDFSPLYKPMTESKLDEIISRL